MCVCGGRDFPLAICTGEANRQKNNALRGPALPRRGGSRALGGRWPRTKPFAVRRKRCGARPARGAAGTVSAPAGYAGCAPQIKAARPNLSRIVSETLIATCRLDKTCFVKRLWERRGCAACRQSCFWGLRCERNAFPYAKLQLSGFL